MVYRVFRLNRSDRVGVVWLSSDVGSSIEYLFIEVVVSDDSLLLGVIYNNIDFLHLLTLLADISLVAPNIVLCGHFNCNLLTDNTFTHNMRTLNLRSVNTTTPTHLGGVDATLLELFFVSDAHDVALYDQLYATAFSKPNLIFITLKFSVEF